MNHQDVALIGVFDPDGNEEGFCYTVDAPTNLWIEALCSDGSRMGHEFMAFILNELIEADGFGEGAEIEVADQDGVTLIATVGEEVPNRSVKAFLANSATVRRVYVTVNHDL